MICKILRRFVNTLTVDDKYFRLNKDSLTEPIRVRKSEKQKIFHNFFFFFTFLKSRLNYEHFEKEMTLIADVFV